MIEEALKFVADLKLESAKPQVVHETRDRRVVSVGGAEESYIKDFPARGHKVETLDDLIALANRFAGEDQSPVVWYNSGAVKLVVNDDGHRDDSVTLNLIPSVLYSTIAALDPKRWYDPKSFVRLLRVDLHGALEAQTLLDPVRRVRFDNGVTTTMEKTRVRESMGREITSAVKTEVEIPEYVMLQTSVYKTPGVALDVLIKAAVEVDPSQGLFQLAVLPDEIQNAVLRTVDAIGISLKAGLNETTPCYQGSPS